MASYYAQYWGAYGGVRSLLSSKYFVLAILFAWISPAYWLGGGWVPLSLQIFPNLLGFTLGGYALILSMGGEKFLLSLAGGRKLDVGYSKFVIFNASYVHFVVFQSLTLAAAMLFNGFNGFNGSGWSWFVSILESVVSLDYYCFNIYGRLGLWLNFAGSVLMFYTVLLVFPTALNIFRMAVNYDNLRRVQKSKEKEKYYLKLQVDEGELKRRERQRVAEKVREVRKKVRGY